jgi:hypothetical protein
MADSTLSITVRDTTHPCAPYQTTKHSFRVQIFHCDGTPLFWNGIDYTDGVRLNVRGAKGGLIHGQVKVPPGCYLVRAFAWCNNVETDWAYVGVGCDQTVCVNLIPTAFRHCIKRVLAGLLMGSVVFPKEGEKKVSSMMPNDVKEAAAILTKIAGRLPEGELLPSTPTTGELEKMLREEKAKGSE